MNIIVFGATGDVGRRVVTEALTRGHEVIAVVRRATQLETLPPSVNGQVIDVANVGQVAELIVGHDLAISALRPPDGQEAALVSLTHTVLNAAAQSQLRVLIVGGAASLKMPGQNGHTVLTTPGFLPESVVPIAQACQAQYELCVAEREADWSYLCPPAMLMPGTRTGHYRLGTDTLLVDPAGQSEIAMEDFAVALIDEAETPRYHQRRFTVAY